MSGEVLCLGILRKAHRTVLETKKHSISVSYYISFCSF